MAFAELKKNSMLKAAGGFFFDEGPQYRFWLIPEKKNQEARTLMDCRLNPDDNDEEVLWV
jgi:hypothetical protein